MEQVTDSRPRPGMMEKIKLVAEHSAAALNNSISHESLFLLPVWRAIGSVVEALRGRTLAKVIAATVAILILVAAMIWMKWDYRVEGKGRLMPIVKRDVFAAREGRVTKVLVTSGQRVAAGTPVVELENEDIRSRLLAATNEYNERRKEANGLETELNNLNRTTNKDDYIRLAGKLQQTKLAIEGAKTQVTILTKMREDLTVRTPIDGVIATFDPDKVLLYRPVQQGELLLEVMDTSKDWHLELDVPEHRLGHILRAQEREKDEKLPVEFLLATETEVTYQGTLGPIASRANVSDEQGTVVEVYADISPEDKIKLKDKYRIGAEVRAKINCGPYSLWYVLFGDVLEFIRKRLWF
ncbi:MAG: efflux RND transporter periplasmic adaptor subunit [Planctomycetales bacterium]